MCWEGTPFSTRFQKVSNITLQAPLIISNKLAWHLSCLNIYWPGSRVWDQPAPFLSLLFSSSCLLKVCVHKIFRGSSSEADIVYTIAPVQVYCTTETDILPPEKSKELMGLISAPGAYCQTDSLGSNPAWDTSVSGSGWNELTHRTDLVPFAWV